MPDVSVVEATDLSRVHRDGRRELRSLDHVSLAVAAGEVVAVMGSSGSGKTTLLHLLGGIDQPSSGHVKVMGTDWQALRGNERARFRSHHCGFVVQGFALLPQATAFENIETPMVLTGVKRQRRKERVDALLARVDLSMHSAKLPEQLSGGQQQRVAIARALANQPNVVLADEPTGSLDSATAAGVVEMLLEVAREQMAAVVLVTHDPAVADRADRVIHLRSGRTEKE